MMMPITELRSRARVPSTPMAPAARSEPAIEPATMFTPSSRAADAPAKDSSLTPCTANGRSRIRTKTPASPPTRPRATPAMRELRTRASSSP
ncbi:hypothetical protein SVIOM74S_10204 [Streptomyces violarus]